MLHVVVSDGLMALLPQLRRDAELDGMLEREATCVGGSASCPSPRSEHLLHCSPLHRGHLTVVDSLTLCLPCDAAELRGVVVHEVGNLIRSRVALTMKLVGEAHATERCVVHSVPELRCLLRESLGAGDCLLKLHRSEV